MNDSIDPARNVHKKTGRDTVRMTIIPSVPAGRNSLGAARYNAVLLLHACHALQRFSQASKPQRVATEPS